MSEIMNSLKKRRALFIITLIDDFKLWCVDITINKENIGVKIYEENIREYGSTELFPNATKVLEEKHGKKGIWQGYEGLDLNNIDAYIKKKKP
ncbi:44932_t:CDS:2 [Gigaspora margarita]|uniref:44932_t:CDS:1 n=1 Tax=Gigaspora margarita TaxID=4874 RepID=A0ABM8VYZ7_GIGMA|nr:44932_t:CDS:2 [Gigaspora margarita]